MRAVAIGRARTTRQSAVAGGLDTGGLNQRGWELVEECGGWGGKESATAEMFGMHNPKTLTDAVCRGHSSVSFISSIHLISATALQGWCCCGLSVINGSRERSRSTVICQKLKGVEN